MIGKTHYGCTNARNKGICDNRRSMSRIKLEEQVLGALRTNLMDEKLCAEFCAEYTRHMNELRQAHNASLARYHKELAKLERERKKLVQSILNGVPGEVLKDDAIRINDRKKELERILDTAEEAPVLFHPNMAKRFHQEVKRLIESLNTEEHRAEAAGLIRNLIERIVLSPDEGGDRLVVDLVGDLAGSLSTATGSDKPPVPSDAVSLREPWFSDFRRPSLAFEEIQQV